jgi:hypothetical protein
MPFNAEFGGQLQDATATDFAVRTTSTQNNNLAASFLTDFIAHNNVVLYSVPLMSETMPLKSESHG